MPKLLSVGMNSHALCKVEFLAHSLSSVRSHYRAVPNSGFILSSQICAVAIMLLKYPFAINQYNKQKCNR